MNEENFTPKRALSFTGSGIKLRSWKNYGRGWNSSLHPDNFWKNSHFPSPYHLKIKAERGYLLRKVSKKVSGPFRS
jgi:hypothetical protein